MDTQAAQLLLDVGLIVVLVLVGVRLYRRRRRAAASAAAPEQAPSRAIANRDEAEQAVAAHLVGLGFTDARSLPPGSRDDAVDVIGRDVDAHVRWHAKPTDVATVERLKAAARGRNAALYSFAGCTSAALRRADAEGVALFRLQVDRSAVPLNTAAKELSGAAGA